MPPKNKNKKKGGGGGSRGGAGRSGSGHGDSRGGAGRSGGGHGDSRGSVGSSGGGQDGTRGSSGGGQGGAHSILPVEFSILDVDEEIVEVLYCEQTLTKMKWVLPDNEILDDWLLRCVQDSHVAWRHRLSTALHPTHLRGRFVLEDAVKFGDIIAGFGAVVVEVGSDYKEHGFVNQLAEANASSFSMDEKLRVLVAKLEAKMKVNMAVDVDAQVEAKIQANIEGRVDTLMREREEARYMHLSKKPHDGQILHQLPRHDAFE